MRDRPLEILYILLVALALINALGNFIDGDHNGVTAWSAVALADIALMQIENLKRGR